MALQTSGPHPRTVRDEEKGLVVIPIAIDGIAVVVNPKNPVKNLTLEQYGNICWEITNWKQVGGKDGAINAFTREGSGTRALEDLVMEDSQISSRVGVRMLPVLCALLLWNIPILIFPWECQRHCQGCGSGRG